MEDKEGYGKNKKEREGGGNKEGRRNKGTENKKMKEKEDGIVKEEDGRSKGGRWHEKRMKMEEIENVLRRRKDL